MVGSARSRLWHLITSELDVVTRLFGSCFTFLSILLPVVLDTAVYVEIIYRFVLCLFCITAE